MFSLSRTAGPGWSCWNLPMIWWGIFPGRRILDGLDFVGGVGEFIDLSFHWRSTKMINKVWTISCFLNFSRFCTWFPCFLTTWHKIVDHNITNFESYEGLYMLTSFNKSFVLVFFLPPSKSKKRGLGWLAPTQPKWEASHLVMLGLDLVKKIRDGFLIRAIDPGVIFVTIGRIMIVSWSQTNCIVFVSFSEVWGGLSLWERDAPQWDN